MSQTIGEAIRDASRSLEQGGISEPRAAAEILLADLLALSRPSLVLETHRSLDTLQCERYAARIRRRLQGEPVQYITGIQEFWSLPLRVNPHVLIPRSETELLVEHGVRLLHEAVACPPAAAWVLDVGTGSGNIAISLAHTLPFCRVVGIDISREALRVAQQNAHDLAMAERLMWVQGDLVGPLRPTLPRFALCVSNLPYVTLSEWACLPREIKAYEPTLALTGGEDGLVLFRRLIPMIPDLLLPGGILLLEVGWQQAAAVAALARQQARFRDVGIYKDFAGIDRVIWARKS
jgi:release factor glutamine methyltransferase